MTSTKLRTPLRVCAIALASALALGFSHTASAQWKWKDKAGHVQYSDLPPPPSVSEQEILQRPAGQSRRAPVLPESMMAASAPASAPKTADPALEAKRRKAEQDEAAKAKADDAKVAAARAENCNRAKAQLRSLDDGMRIARVNDKGEREVLDDKARADEVKRTREIMAADCK
jgi:uncharacterized protein DUF4124